MSASLDTVAETYFRDGFIFPVEVMSSDEGENVREDLERAEAECADDPEKLAMIRSYPDRLIPSFDKLIRNPKLVQVVESILGSDLMVWSSGLFIKEAKTTKIVSWHQDLTYWGLDEIDEITAWVALSPSNLDSGCMRFVPGSHKKRLVAHHDTFNDNNLLTRGQEIKEKVDDRGGVDVILDTGQASLHHGHLFHSSGPNLTDYRRIGTAIRYIKPSMKQRSGDKTLVALVNGEDRYDHFTIAGAPKGWLHEDDFGLCIRDSEIKRRVLYEGAELNKGQRY